MNEKLGCISCGRHLHDECSIQPCCCSSGKNPSLSFTSANPLSAKGVGRPILDSDEVTDLESTGRKRAAMLYPIDKTKSCEWRMQKNCGGGTNPIIGCLAGLQQHRQHGPDKDTLNNSPENVHRICATCHTRWHYMNDAFYDPTIPHSPVAADLQEVIQNEVDWKAGKFREITSSRLEMFKKEQS